jgi:hypothetical protein
MYTITFEKDTKKIWQIVFHKPESLKDFCLSVLRCWSIEKPKITNWSRFMVMTPLFTFSVLGWLFWGTKPE